MKMNDLLGTPSRFTCPECHGALWEIEDETMLTSRCHVGHAFAADAVLSAQADEIEKLLEALQRSRQERAALVRRMAERERGRRRNRRARLLEDRARGYDEDALLVRELMRTGFNGTVSGASEHRGDVGGEGDGEI